jgi:hypothetical protein
VIEQPNAEALGLVGEVVGDAGAGEDDEADGKRIEEVVIALKGRGLGVTRPVGLEDDLRDLAIIGPGGGDRLGAPRRSAMKEWTMSGCLARTRSSAVQMAPTSLNSGPPAKAILAPGGVSGSISARRLAAMKSRLSMMADVNIGITVTVH